MVNPKVRSLLDNLPVHFILPSGELQEIDTICPCFQVQLVVCMAVHRDESLQDGFPRDTADLNLIPSWPGGGDDNVEQSFRRIWEDGDLRACFKVIYGGYQPIVETSDRKTAGLCITIHPANVCVVVEAPATRIRIP